MNGSLVPTGHAGVRSDPFLPRHIPVSSNHSAHGLPSSFMLDIGYSMHYVHNVIKGVQLRRNLKLPKYGSTHSYYLLCSIFNNIFL